MRGWSYNVLYVYRRTTNDNDDDDDDDASRMIVICQIPRHPSCRHLRHLQMTMDYGFHAST